MLKIIFILSILCCSGVLGFWDIATTTIRMPRTDTTPRQSFFRWQWTIFPQFWFWNYDWNELYKRRRLCIMAGISIDFLCLTTAAILNRRALVTSSNWVEPYMTRQQDLRIWALGRAGLHYTPYRYRVYRVTRVVPRSSNPEHCHGARCTHSPRDDVCVIISRDQMYIFSTYPTRYHYAYRAYFTTKHKKLSDGPLWFAGSGFEYMQHIVENYKIFHCYVSTADVVDCSNYIPKWWGKFICIRNTNNFPGLQNGGGLFVSTTVVGTGSFEIRINDDRIYVFTDYRYYYHKVHHYAYLYSGQYYEYAYPQWSINLGFFFDGYVNNPYIPNWQPQSDFYPLGK